MANDTHRKRYSKEQWDKFPAARLLPEQTERVRNIQMKMGNVTSYNHAVRAVVEAGLPIVERQFSKKSA